MLYAIPIIGLIFVSMMVVTVVVNRIADWASLED